MLQGLGRFSPRPGRLILPDVCCDVTIVGGRPFLTGPMTRARLSRHIGQEVLLLQIAPAIARRLLGVPVVELTDRVLPLEDVSAALASAIATRLETNRLAELVRPLPAHCVDGRFATAAKALARDCTVHDVAARVALSERQLERLVYEHAGMAPKLFARIVRFRRAVMAGRAGTPLAAAAALHGYADQAHLSREARTFTDQPMQSLLPNVGNLQEVEFGEL
jgi:AraC-like DNA-binding protein